MNVLEAIYARRAVRSFTAEGPSKEELLTLLRAAVQAPSAMNAQPWIFAVVEDRARLSRWSEQAKAMMLDELTRTHDPKTAHYRLLLAAPDFDVFYRAPMLVVIGATPRGRYSEADCWLAAENFMLAACDARFGTCCIGFAIPLLDTLEVKAELGFPPDSVVVAPIIVGRAASTPPPVPRVAPRVLAWL